MRTIALIFVSLAVVFVAGCDQTGNAPVGPGIGMQPQRSAAEQMVPFHTSSYTFHTTAVAPATDCNTGERRVYLAGEGTATHLGRYTADLSFCSRPNGVLYNGRGTFVAANGDLLRFVFNGTSSFVAPNSLPFTSFATFTGGTGRFEDASGDATVAGTVNTTTGAGDGSWDGTISSVGSSGE